MTVAGQDEPGERLIVTGRTLDGRKPVSGVSLYVFHTDIRGRYATETTDPNAGGGWSCTSPRRYPTPKFTCRSSAALQPGHFTTIGVKVHGEPDQTASEFWLKSSVDPKERIRESNGDNNVSIGHF